MSFELCFIVEFLIRFMAPLSPRWGTFCDTTQSVESAS